MRNPRRIKKFDYEEIPKGYYDIVHNRKKGIQSFWHHNKFRSIVEAFCFEKKDLNLDIGCGPGTFLGQYSRSGNKIGIDSSINQVNYANEYYKDISNVYFTTKQILNLDIQTDVVTLIEFIEHISLESFRKLLLDVNRIAVPQHFVIITTPNYFSLWPILEVVMKFIPSGLNYDQQHITRFTKKKLNVFLEVNGYEVLKLQGIQGFGSFFAPLSWSLAWKIVKFEEKFVKYFGFQILCVAQKK